MCSFKHSITDSETSISVFGVMYAVFVELEQLVEELDNDYIDMKSGILSDMFPQLVDDANVSIEYQASESCFSS